MSNEQTFPSIPGIDTADGLARMMNKPHLYEKVLRDFYSRFLDEMVQLDALLATAQYEEAARRVHSAKGLSGTVGALPLQEAARQLEAPLRVAQAPSTELQRAFADELARVLAGIRQAFNIV